MRSYSSSSCECYSFKASSKPQYFSGCSFWSRKICRTRPSSSTHQWEYRPTMTNTMPPMAGQQDSQIDFDWFKLPSVIGRFSGTLSEHLISRIQLLWIRRVVSISLFGCCYQVLNSFTLAIRQAYVPTPPQKNDITIMDYFVKLNLPLKQLKRLNRCWVHLQVLFLSDISYANESYILPCYKQGNVMLIGQAPWTGHANLVLLREIGLYGLNPYTISRQWIS